MLSLDEGPGFHTAAPGGVTVQQRCQGHHHREQPDQGPARRRRPGTPRLMRVQSLLQLARRCSQLAPVSGLHVALASLGRRWLPLHEEILRARPVIRDLVRRIVPRLLERPGVGIHSAAQLLVIAGGNPRPAA